MQPFADVGATVIVIDHIPKRREGRAAGPIGSMYKLAKVDGAALRVYGSPWNRTTSGWIGVSVDKDRLGHLPAATGQPVAKIAGTYSADAFGYRIDQPGTQRTTADQDELDQNILDYVAAHPNSTLTAIRKGVPGSNQRVGDAVEALAAQGAMVSTPHGRGYQYHIPPSAVTQRLEM